MILKTIQSYNEILALGCTISDWRPFGRVLAAPLGESSVVHPGWYTLEPLGLCATAKWFRSV